MQYADIYLVKQIENVGLKDEIFKNFSYLLILNITLKNFLS